MTVPRPPRDDRRDRNLLSDLAAGRTQALGELYDRHASSLFRHAVALMRNRTDADDLVQTVFVKVATMGAPLLGVRKPASYLHRTLHTTWIDGRRREARGEQLEDQAGSEPLVVPTIGDSIDVARALDALPSEQRAVVVLHVVDGFSFREIGRSTGVSMFTAAARYRLATSKLRAMLRPPERKDR